MSHDNSIILKKHEMIADKIGESIFIAARFFYEKSKKQGLDLTEAEIFDAVVYACFSKANRMLKAVRESGDCGP